MPTISIVVPTRDRPSSLSRCLAAIGGQATRAELDVVIVDDGSRDREQVRALVAAQPGARLVEGGGRGPAAARNAGARSARGEVVCFTDDDCEPEPGWAQALSACIARGAVAVAGRTINPAPDDRVAAASELIAAQLSEFSFRDGRIPFAASNNLACSRSVIREVPFDEAYPSPGGEDRDWCARVAEAGFALVREPGAVVAHRQTLDLPGFWRRNARFGQAARRFATTHGRGLMPSPAALYADLLREGFRAGPAVGSLVCLAQLATATGYVGAALARR